VILKKALSSGGCAILAEESGGIDPEKWAYVTYGALPQ
jgi:hypothetical protein